MKLTDGEVAHVMARGTSNIEAWQLVEAALRHDPNYAYAWATLGFTYWWEDQLGYAGIRNLYSRTLTT